MLTDEQLDEYERWAWGPERLIEVDPGHFEVLVQEIRAMKRGEFVCKKCGLRKDAEHEDDCGF